MTSPRRCSSEESTKTLRQQGYVSRQNSLDQPLALNLGGPRSQLNRTDCQGAVLLNPSRDLIFGACTKTMQNLRANLMVQQGDVWVRKNGVPGPQNATNLVEVHFVIDDAGKNRVVCDTGMGRVWIDGYFDALISNSAGCDWDAIEKFLARLQMACRKKAKSLATENDKKAEPTEQCSAA